MVKKIRRVVTGHDARGKSVILSDGPSPPVLLIPGRTDFGLTNLWVTDGAPGSNEGNADAAARPVVLEPPAGGTIFRVVEFPPDKAAADFDRKTAFASMGADHAMDPDASRHPGMHKTATVDRLRDRALRRDLGPHGRGGDTARGRRLPGPARHQPRVEQPQRRALPRGLHPCQRDVAGDCTPPTSDVAEP